MFALAAGTTAATVENDTENAEINNSSVSSAANVSSINSVDGKGTNPPGFEAVFAIAGLLAVAYLVLRQRED